MTKKQRVFAAAAIVSALAIGTVGVSLAQEDPSPGPATAGEAWAHVDELKVQIEEVFSGETPPSDEQRAALIHGVSEAIRQACEVDPEHPNCT